MRQGQRSSPTSDWESRHPELSGWVWCVIDGIESRLLPHVRTTDRRGLRPVTACIHEGNARWNCRVPNNGDVGWATEVSLGWERCGTVDRVSSADLPNELGSPHRLPRTVMRFLESTGSRSGCPPKITLAAAAAPVHHDRSMIAVVHAHVNLTAKAMAAGKRVWCRESARRRW